MDAETYFRTIRSRARAQALDIGLTLCFPEDADLEDWKSKLPMDMCLDKICREISTPGRKDAYELVQCAIRTYFSDCKAVGRICTALCENESFNPEEKIDKLKTIILYNCSVVSDQQIFHEYQSHFVEKSFDIRKRYQSNPGLALQACDDAITKGIELQKGVENEFMYQRFQNIERALLAQKKMIIGYINSRNYSKYLGANQTDSPNNPN